MTMTGLELSQGSGSGAGYFASDFHKLSQDLRTPLNSISGFAELLLLDEGLSPASAEYVRAILTGSEALTAAVVSYLERAEEGDPPPAAVPRRFAFRHMLSAAAPGRLRSWGTRAP